MLRFIPVITLALLALFGSASPALAADSDGDGWMDSEEVAIGTDPNDNCGVNAWPPDINDDGFVDTTGDISVLSGEYSTTVPPSPKRHDIARNDNIIDIFDITRAANYYGQTCLTSRYIDFDNGNDTTGDGTQGNPWKTAQKVSNLSDQSFQVFFFKRGTTQLTPLILNTANHTRVDMYGTSGGFPRITTSFVSDCVQINNAVETTILHLEAINCHYGGFTFTGASTHNLTIDSVVADHNIAGVWLKQNLPTSEFIHLTRSQIVNNDRMSVNTPCPPDCNDDSGAFGVLVNSGKLLMDFNQCDANEAASYDYVRDGACVEFFGGGSGSIIRKNKASSNDAFTETSAGTENGIYFVQNWIYGGLAIQKGFNIRDTSYLYSNSIRLTGASSQGIIFGAGGEGSEVRNNLSVAVQKSMYVPSGFIFTEDHNFLTGGTQNLTPSGTDVIGSTDSTQSTNNYHLTATSPAHDAGVDSLTNQELTDLDGELIPMGSAPDIGVDEITE